MRLSFYNNINIYQLLMFKRLKIYPLSLLFFLAEKERDLEYRRKEQSSREKTNLILSKT